ncbi:MAG TPA: TonB-dependent receptor [Terriglobales bacterium]|nr:TonB-dependent receptor [Terriglobales bacterium]
MNRSFPKSSLMAVVVLLCAVVLGALPVLAQTGTSSVRGTVDDPQGRVIPGATVTLTSTENNAVRTQKTGPAGNFSFDLLPPGDYKLEAEAPNFKKAELSAVHALVATPLQLSIILQIGAANEVVTVNAENAAVQVNTQDSSLGNTFVSQQIAELPIESRNVLSLLSLQPGVTKDGYVAGGRMDQANVTLDGVDVNDAQSNQSGPDTLGATTSPSPIAGPVLRLNSEAISEFRLSTVSSNAAGGRSSGAQVQLVTKSGTNHFHGSAFDFNRNTIFTANDWFNNHNGISRPALIRNTFGPAIGGPIIKDKLFFFYSYEGRRDASQSPVSANTVPLPSLSQGIVKFIASNGQLEQIGPADIANIFPDTGGVNPAALTALAQGTKFTANSTQVGDGLNTSGFVFNAPAPVSLNSHVAKFDYNLSQAQQLSARLNVIYDHITESPNFPGTRAPSIWNHPWGLAVSHTWSIRDNLINNFHYGMTRQGITSGGELQSNEAYFRLVYQPEALTYDQSRTTPVQNFVDDVSWIKGRHTFQFGANLELISNSSSNFSNSFDSATTNPSGYKTNLLINAVNQYLTETAGYTVSSAYKSSVENAITALLGRFTQYTANYLFAHDGSLMAAGTPKARTFATQGYEGYAQDIWKMTPNVTLTAGLRYSLWRPVYETHGFEVQPEIPFGTFFQNRVNAMNNGQAYNQDIIINRSGPANGGPPMYNWDKTVFLPRVGIAWSPRTGDGIWSKLIGKSQNTVLRGGFAMLPDYYGESIATFFDQRNTLGFASANVLPVNTYNVGCGHYVVVGNGLTNCTPALGPQFTSFTQDVRSLPNLTTPANLTFPLQKSDQAFPTRIESSLDSQLQTPRNYEVNLTYERGIGENGVLQLSYLGHFARNLLAERDVATPADLRDPKSGMDFYTAATILEKARQAGVPFNQVGVPGGAVPVIPYFENLFPVAGMNAALCSASKPCASSTQAVYQDALFNTNDWTTTMLDMNNLSTLGSYAFFQPQYGALDAWSTVAYSNYHAFAASFRERIHNDLTLDFNYTFSHSLDNASGLQAAGSYSNSALILNPFRPQDNYTASDFDMRHIININSVWELPFGHGKPFGRDSHGVVQQLIGGWQLSNIFRWNTGVPLGAPYDAAEWSTNWEVQSYTNITRPIPISGCSTRLVETPQMFGNCEPQAFLSFRNSYPGETGLRNYFRLPGYVDLDLGLGKTWKMPYNEGHSLQFRWETFNVTNTQEFQGLDFSRSGFGITPGSTEPSPNFTNWTSVVPDSARVMQFALLYRF